MRKSGLITGMLWAAVLCCCVLLLLSTKGKPGRSIGGPSTGARNSTGQGRFIERYPEPAVDIPPSIEQLAKLRVYDFDPKQGISQDTFTLWTVDDLGRPAPVQQEHLRLTGKQLDNGDYHLVVHAKDMPQLESLLFYVRYHAEQWHPRNIEPGTFFGLEGDRLWFAKLDVPGVVCAGLARVRPDVNGPTKLSEGVICEIAFVKRPFDYKPRWLDHAPDGSINRARNIQAYQDPETCCPVLYWEETNSGDLNNDGEVSMADIVPVAFRYGKFSTNAVDDALDRMADGNLDGEVNRRDVWLIDPQYGALLQGYRIYRRPVGQPQKDEVILKHRTDPLLPFSVHRRLDWDPAQPVCYRYYDRELPLTKEPAEWIYRIVPYDAADDREGNRSDVEVRVRVSKTMAQVVGQ